MGILFPSARPILPANALIDSFDFTCSTDVGNIFDTRNSGGSVSIPTPTDNGHFGVMAISTGATTTGRGCIQRAPSQYGLVNPLWLWTIGLRLPTLSAAAQEYVVRVGLTDTFAGDFVDGVYFEYDRTVSTFWRMCAANTSNYTRVTSTFAATTNWINLTIYGTASVAVYKANNVVLGAITTNLPTVYIGQTIQITKSAGTTARTVEVDYTAYGYVPAVEQT